MRSKISFVVIILVLGVGGYFWVNRGEGFSLGENFNLGGLVNSSTKEEGVRIEIEIADTPEKQEMGLSGRETLPENSGMFFVFETPDFYQFWMKDMLFPIDLIWLDESFKITGIHENLLPENYPDEIISPSFPAKYALEVNSGFAVKNGLKVGQSGELNIEKNIITFKN